MVKIFTDSGCMMNMEEGLSKNIHVIPLRVTLQGKDYQDMEELSSKTILEQIHNKVIPTSSQPPIGEVVEQFEHAGDHDILQITIADGLSGTFQTAVSAKNMCHNKERITIFNSRTLCGPQKYLVELAAKLAEEKLSVKEIVTQLEEKLSECQSYLMPSDFGFLKRGGRMTTLAATMGGLLKINPVVMQTRDGTRLDKFHVARTFGMAVDQIVKEFRKANLDICHRIYVSHADAIEKCEQAIQKLKAAFPHVEIETISLSPAMITQGGPGCVAIQFIKK